MAGHGNGRAFLADEVKALSSDFKGLSEKLAGVDGRVIGQTVALTTLIEDSKRAREHRDKLWEELRALRSEQGQIQLAQSGIPDALARLAAAVEGQGKKLGEIETDRQQWKGGMNLASASARIAWGIVGGIFLTLLAAFIAAARWLWGLWSVLHTPPPGGPH